MATRAWLHLMNSQYLPLSAKKCEIQRNALIPAPESHFRELRKDKEHPRVRGQAFPVGESAGSLGSANRNLQIKHGFSHADFGSGQCPSTNTPSQGEEE